MQDIISESDKIELLSEDIQEIMGKPPKWIIRWGITLMLIVLLLIFIGSLIIKYPDVISGSVFIVSENPPVPIIAQSTGKIETIFIRDQEIVKEGSYLAIVENTAHYKHVIELKQKLISYREKTEQNDFSNLIEFPQNYSLGIIQGSFSNFQRQYNEYKNFLSINIIGKKVIALSDQINDYKLYISRLNVQVDNLKQSLLLQYKQFKRDSSLFSNNVIAAMEFEKSEQNYLQVNNNYQSLLAEVSNTNMQINQLHYQIIDLQSQLLEKNGSMINSLKEALDNLLSNINNWEKLYTLISPIEGRITFVNYWSQNQYVITGNQVFTIIPIKPRKIMGKIKFPIVGSGKVEKGQKVLISLDNFPNTEFGMLNGKITSISLIPEQTKEGYFYSAEIFLTNGLTTNYKKVLPLNQEMSGNAQIITKNLSIFDRLVYPIKAALKKSI